MYFEILRNLHAGTLSAAAAARTRDRAALARMLGSLCEGARVWRTRSEDVILYFEADLVDPLPGGVVPHGELVEQGTSDAVLGNPVTSVAWLANKLSQFGVTFEPGHTILTGSFTAAVPVGPGDAVVAEFDQGLGPVSTSFSTKENDS